MSGGVDLGIRTAGKTLMFSLVDIESKRSRLTETRRLEEGQETHQEPSTESDMDLVKQRHDSEKAHAISQRSLPATPEKQDASVLPTDINKLVTPWSFSTYQ
jgi:hypothetical protein